MYIPYMTPKLQNLASLETSTLPSSNVQAAANCCAADEPGIVYWGTYWDNGKENGNYFTRRLQTVYTAVNAVGLRTRFSAQSQRLTCGKRKDLCCGCLAQA